MNRNKVERLKNMSCFQIQKLRDSFSNEFTPEEIQTAYNETGGKGFFKWLFPDFETQEKKTWLHRLFMASIIPTRRRK